METEPSQSSGKFVAPILGEEARTLISCNQKLQELGIDDTIELSRIVVIGDQSTGKSSLIEAISKIEVPKAAGLCTRCPIAINLSSGRPPRRNWECSVFIEERYLYDKSIKQKQVSKSNPLGPWQIQDNMTTTQIGKTHDQKELIDLINAAQTQILNPHRTRQASHETAASDPERFSPNIVRIDISVGDCPNLSFIDLPGVIQSAGLGQPGYYVNLVESLARSYARDENNVIINCLPMIHDVANSKAYSIIQQEKAQSHTMAVFTKVDLAREQERQECLNTYFVGEREEEFEHGYHVVMLKDTKGSCETPTEAEAAFFSQPPWSSLSETTRERFGVQNLVDLLRKILFQKTAETLPENLEKISIRIAQVQDLLDQMPPPPDTSELPYQLREYMIHLTNNIRKLFLSGQEDASVSSRNKMLNAMQAFDERIQGDRPTMVIRTAAEAKQLEKAEKTERLHREGSDSQPVSVDGDSSDNEEPGTQSKVMGRGPVTLNNRRARLFQLEEIRQMNKERYVSSIPGDIELKAVEEMHRQSVQSWDVTFNEFMSKMSKIITSEVLNCVRSTFAANKHLPLYAEVVGASKEYLDTVIQLEWNHLQRHCDAERAHPLTFNDTSMKQAEMESLNVRRQKRAEVRLEVERASRKANNLASKKKVKEPSLDDIGPDSWDVEVQMAAKTRAYYEVASHRFVDTICQNVIAHLIPLCHDALVDAIKRHLGLDNIEANRDRIVALMTEASDREAKRRRLNDEFLRLRAGHDFISTVLGNLNPRPNRDFVFMEVDGSPIVNFDDVVNIPNTPVASSGKRKLTDENLNTEPNDPFTPTKRSRLDQSGSLLNSFQAAAGNRYATRLPSRSRTAEPEE